MRDEFWHSKLMIAFSSRDHLYVKRGPQLAAKSSKGSMILKTVGTTASGAMVQNPNALYDFAR